MTNLEVRIGSRLYYTDSKEYFGKVIKILKRTVWVEELNGNIEKRWPLDFANNMLLNSFDEHILDLEKNKVSNES
jgi:hypothetical protein